MYTDAYLFDLATKMLEKGKDTITVTRHIVKTCRVGEEHAGRIVSEAFDPCK